jgi:hypothetical protein
MGNVKLQARLNPAFEAEAKALKVHDHYIKQGETTRRIITEALLQLSGEPLPKRTTIQQVASQLTALQKQVTAQHSELLALLNRLQELDLSAYRNDSGVSMEDEIGGMVAKSFLNSLSTSAGMVFDDDD